MKKSRSNQFLAKLAIAIGLIWMSIKYIWEQAGLIVPILIMAGCAYFLVKKLPKITHELRIEKIKGIYQELHTGKKNWDRELCSHAEVIAGQKGYKRIEIEIAKEQIYLKEIESAINANWRIEGINDESAAKISDVCKALAIKEHPKDHIKNGRRYYIRNSKNETYKPIKSDLLLRKEEYCYFRTDAVWYREEQVSKKLYGGISARKNLGGISLGIGGLAPIASQRSEVNNKGEGKIYITNKRIQFITQNAGIEISRNRITNVEKFDNAIIVHKNTGKPDYFLMDKACQNVAIDILFEQEE